LIVLSAALLVFGIFFAIETAGLRQECNEKRSDVYAVASAEQTEAALAAAAGAGSEDEGWCHPNGVVVSTPPKRSTDRIWTWTDEEGVATEAMDEPKLLLRVKSLDLLRPHTPFYWVGKKSGRFSDVQTKPHDVGGYVCGGAKKKEANVLMGVELAVVHENAHANRLDRAGDAPPNAVVELGAAAALAAEERDAVARLTTALQKCEAALLKGSEENAQLKEEIEALRAAVQPRGGASLPHVTEFAVLPRGWSETLSESNGAPYYTNAHTGEMVWEKPTLPAPPAGWTVHPHDDGGQFYHNASTSVTTWDHPDDVLAQEGV
jgi:hypothetical protein